MSTHQETVEMKTKIQEFLSTIESDKKRADALKLVDILQEESGYQPHLSGRIVGFGSYHYRYESGHEGDCQVVGFSPSKQRFSVYIMPGFSQFQDELAKLGKHKTGKCCLYINKLADVDEDILRKIVRESVEHMQGKYDCKEFP